MRSEDQLLANKSTRLDFVSCSYLLIIGLQRFTTFYGVFRYPFSTVFCPYIVLRWVPFVSTPLVCLLSSFVLAFLFFFYPVVSIIVPTCFGSLSFSIRTTCPYHLSWLVLMSSTIVVLTFMMSLIVSFLIRSLLDLPPDLLQKSISVVRSLFYCVFK
jgi:hypothetical protein